MRRLLSPSIAIALMVAAAAASTFPVAAGGSERAGGTTNTDMPGAEQIPDTPVGRRLAQWLAAFNAADVAALRAFHADASPPGEGEMRTAFDLLIRRETGGVDLHRVLAASNFEITVLAYARLTEAWLEGRMTVAPEPPHHVIGLGALPAAAPAGSEGRPGKEDEMWREMTRDSE